MESLQKVFEMETDSHSIVTTYQPSHIDFRVIDKRTRHAKRGLFYDSTLPASVREECEAVSDLFEYLQGKSSSEMQVEGDCLRFKVVRIKKERWYSLDMHDEGQDRPDEQKMEEEGEGGEAEVEVEVEGKNALRTLTLQRDELLQQNQALRQQVERLNTTNQQLQQKLQSNDLQVLIENGLMQLDEGMEEENRVEGIHPIEKQNENLQEQQLPIKKLVITRPTVKNLHYKVEKQTVTKISEQTSVLMFEECVRRGERAYFSVQLLTDLPSGWIVFGVLVREREQLPYCLFSRDSIAYSGSLATVFNELDTIDLPRKATRGDRIRMQLNASKASVEWLINGLLVCTHRMGAQIWEKDLHPYLMLAHAGDAVRLNCDG